LQAPSVVILLVIFSLLPLAVAPHTSASSMRPRIQCNTPLAACAIPGHTPHHAACRLLAHAQVSITHLVNVDVLGHSAAIGRGGPNGDWGLQLVHL
jgi:hypothetical protein